MMLTLFFFSLLLNLYFGAIVEVDDIGVIEQVDINEEQTPAPTSQLQDMLRRRLVPGGLTSQDKISILNLHNKYRNLTSQGKTYGQPSATNMNQLVWDAGLAQVAQDYSAKCIWAHNSNRHTDMIKYESSASFDYVNQQVGENLFITTGSENLDSLLQGIQYWYSEYTYYTYGTVSGSASCTSGKQCGHYTQLIWATTRYVGCGYTKCATTSGVSFTNGILLVCNYYFSGNIVGYYPYTIGTAGTQCSSDRTCQNGICSGCPNPSWDTYCCQYCSSSSCSNALSSNLLNSPSTCTDGLGTSMSSASSSSSATTKSPTTSSPTTSSPTTSSPTTSPPTTTKSPTTRSPTTSSPTTSSPTTTSSTTSPPTTRPPTASSSTTRSPTTSPPTTSSPTTTTSTRAPTTASSASSTNGCCKAINSRYATFCASISTSSVCGDYSTLCSWNSSC